MASCPACGNKTKGFFKLCDACNRERTLSFNIDAQKKNPIKPIKEPEDDE